MESEHPVVRLCMLGTQAEFQGRIEAARALYQQAWEAAEDDYGACMAAHYLARRQADPQAELRWNLEALRRAQAVGDERVEGFMGSLYLCLGQSYERLGEAEEARRFYDLAAGLGFRHVEE